ncbi:hypothetical protein BT67DRAFT_261735 [Trichocladium antarcticum]|uniref:Znf1 n=1 Tax=Trichocladium antarcticum TaxID=1450529 RepID=A0AAN6UMK2_9PEZI|nr:hypothetical protein BT67DRAFT_261735 [Trichocladium antarcticum]
MGVDPGVSPAAAAAATTPRSSRKRNHADFATRPEQSSSSTKLIPSQVFGNHHTYDDTELPAPSIAKKTRTPKPHGPPPEKRLRRFRAKPPNSFLQIHQRATTQRFFVLSRTRCGTPDCPEEMVEMTGSTGNIYTVVVAQQPSCDCPHARAGNQCKHVLYVLDRVLRARFEYVYQLALLSGELREIFDNAPPPVDAEAAAGGTGNRKPVEGDCPICFCEMEAGEGGEAVVWCRAACGQNMHKGCFETWAATKRQQSGGGDVTCPYCRSVWDGDEDMVKKISKGGTLSGEGYVNVAAQLGISTERDWTTYSRFWSGHPNAYYRGG